MDWLILGFIAVGFLFFWGVWIFAYWLPMARESQRQFKREQVREQAAVKRRDDGPPDVPSKR
jgi:hypothetical protein